MSLTREILRQADARPDPAEIRAQMARVLASPGFARAPRMRRFLAFLVEETLAGREGQLKEYTIATAVFGKPSDFAPGESAVVRVEAGRLRRLLTQYLAEQGAQDAVQIQVPKGSYVPTFHGRPESCAPLARPLGLNPEWPREQRRRVTALSLGLADPTGECEIPDPLMDLVDRLQARCAAIGQRHGGEVEASAGDRLMVYFGWPNTLEDGPARALDAALDMAAEVRAAADGRPLSCRIGIATSEAVTRGAADAGAGLRAVVIGQAPGRATRLQLRAPPGAILVAESTRGVAGDAFDFLPAGELDAGLGGGLAWRLLAPRRKTTRFQAHTGGIRCALVGRTEERALLTSRWRLAREGEGQVVILSGEAGMGKSRLAESALEEIGRNAVRLRAQCSPNHATSTLYPIVRLMRARLGLPPGDGDAAATVPRLLNRLGSDAPLDRDLLADLLSGGETRTAGLSASARKGLTLRLLRRLVLSLGRRRPIVLLVEDVHWADPTTLEFLQDLTGAAAGSPLLVMMTSRVADAVSFPLQTNLTAVRLARLPRGASEALLDGIPGAAQLTPAARALVLERGEGVPLFLEELAKLMLASRPHDASNPRVPESLADLLAAQLDRLGPSRAAAQMAAVIGRTFPRAMLAQVAGGDEAELDAALDQLLAAGILVRDRDDGAEAFAFRHALLRDAAYGSLHEPTRQTLHSRMADTLVEAFPEIAADQPELVAHHLLDAGRSEDAIPFWIDAAGKAAARYALTEAIAQLRMARAALASLEGTDTRERELALLLQLALLIRSAHGYGDLELLGIYERARGLAAELGRPARGLEVTYGLWTQAAGRGDWRRARALAEAFEEQAASATADDQVRIEALRLLGACDTFMGDFARGRDRHLAALALYDPARHGPRFGFDPGPVVAAYLSWTLWLLGRPDEARAHAAKALEMAEAKGHAPTLGMVLCWSIFHAVCEEDLEAVEQRNARLQPLCEERECRYWQPFGAACAEWAAFARDHDPRRLERLLENTEAFEERYLTSCLLLLGARMCLTLGRISQGLELVERAEAFITEHDERIWEPEAARVRGELLRCDPGADHGRADALLTTAIDRAQASGAVALEQRARAALSERRQAAGRPRHAARA